MFRDIYSIILAFSEPDLPAEFSPLSSFVEIHIKKGNGRYTGDQKKSKSLKLTKTEEMRFMQCSIAYYIVHA